MIYAIPDEHRRIPLVFKIFSSFGWKINEKFYQPYQIWSLQKYQYNGEIEKFFFMKTRPKKKCFYGHGLDLQKFVQESPEN